VAALAILASATSATSASAAVDGSLTRYPYLTDSVQRSVTVNWATTTAGASGSVRYGPAGSCTARTASAAQSAIVVNGVAEYQWKATIPVSPDRAYCYRPRLGSTDLLGSDSSPVFTSQVAAGSTAPFSFVVFGDWGQAYENSANPDQQNVLARMAASGARFAVMTGDTGYPDGSQTNYGDLQQRGPDVSGVFAPWFWAVPGRSLPVFNVTGNHGFREAGTQLANWPEAHAASTSGGRYAVESYPSVNGSVPAGYPSFWYAFDAGNARFYVLTAAWADLNLGSGDAYANDAAAHWSPSRAEYKWLASDLASHPRALKFAFWHYPLYADTVGARSDTALQGGRGTLQGLLDANRVNVAFNGHAHGYERNRPDAAGMFSYVLGNGGAELGPVGPCSPFDLYALGSGGSHCGSAPGGLGDDHVFGFATVTVNGSQVTIAPTDELGRTYDVQTYANTSAGFVLVTPPAATGVVADRVATTAPARRAAGACASAAVKAGGPRRDRIAGTAGADLLRGMAGDDILRGGGGADCLYGMAGADRLYGGRGGDRLFGDDGADRLLGGRGDDRLSGGAGADGLSAGAGRNVILGGRGRDSIAARNGRRDVVRCGGGRDIARVDARDLLSGCERVRRS
jgi:hypothetical protein